MYFEKICKPKYPRQLNQNWAQPEKFNKFMNLKIEMLDTDI